MKNRYLEKLSICTALVLSISSISACSNPGTMNTTNNGTNNTQVKVTKAGVIENYSNIVLASYQDSLQGVKNLQSEIIKFVNSPTKEGLEAAKAAWLKSRTPYAQTEGYRFYNGPIDKETGPELRINSWPLDEVFIDYVEGNKTSGIINDLATYPTIDKNMLKETNQKGGDKNISTGFHAIEFLLWGQDLTEGSGAGQREYTDYLTNGQGTNANQDRRGKYLLASADLLVEDMQSLVDDWQDNKAGNYRDELNKLNPDEALTKILIGAGTLSASELSNQRMATPLDVGEREEEHSCFSDSTQSDIVHNTKSIENIILGTYTKTDGTKITGASVYNLINDVKPELAAKIKTQLEASDKLINQIQNPFDQEIRPDNKEGNTRVKSAIDALQTQGITIVEIGSALGLTINTKLE